MATAFDVDVYKVVLPPGAPAGGFDLLMTGPDATKERLQAEIKSQLGYAAHIESRPTNVLLLTLSQAGAAGLQPSKPTARGGGGGGGSSTAGMSVHFNNSPISALVSQLQPFFDPPIIDRSGLTGRFDISLSSWHVGERRHQGELDRAARPGAHSRHRTARPPRCGSRQGELSHRVSRRCPVPPGWRPGHCFQLLSPYFSPITRRIKSNTNSTTMVISRLNIQRLIRS